MMGRTRERYCKRGHDTLTTGRYGRSTCIACSRMQNNTRRFRQRHDGKGLPAYRLRVRAGSRAAAQAAWMMYRACSRNTAQQHAGRLWQAEYVDIDTADMWCIALGTHLSILYPELYRDVVIDVEWEGQAS